MKRLADEFGMTHEAVAAAVGRSRSAVSNLLRLLSLAEPVQALVNDGKLDMGHARALLTICRCCSKSVWRRTLLNGFVGARRRAARPAALHPPAPRSEARADPDVLRPGGRGVRKVGAKVSIRPGRKGSGKLVVEYATLDQLRQLDRRAERPSVKLPSLSDV